MDDRTVIVDHPARAGTALLAVAAVLCAAGCAHRPAATHPIATRPWNLVVVLVDTLRADRLSLYGYERRTSPSLDRLARERGVVFTSCWANAGCTFPSVNSLLASRWPQHFLNRLDTYGMAMPPDTPDLATRLRDRGYATAAVSASLIVRAHPSTINRQGGFQPGFDVFDESCLERPARCVDARAFELLDSLPEPFLLYLHYVDPHQPYRPPGGHRRVFARPSRAPDKGWVKWGNPVTIYRRLYDHDPTAEFDAADESFLSDLYDEEILYFDGQFARLIAHLTVAGKLERTVVAFVSDHGEELGDHGNWGHCRDLAFPTVLAVPLILAVPGLPPGVRGQLVSNLDLTPTLLDLIGAPLTPDLDGHSLRPILERGDAAGRDTFAFAAQGRSRAARDLESMLLLDLGRKTADAFHLEGVRSSPVAQASPALRRALTAWIRAREGGVGSAESLRQAAEIEAELRALGYL